MTVLTDREATLVDRVPTGLLVGGEWRPADSGRTLPVDDPSTGEVIAEVADASVADGKAALDSAVAHQAEWAATPPRVRGEILRRAFELVTERAEDLATVMTLEMGKPLAESRGEIAYGAEFFRWFSEEAVRISGRYSTSPDGNTRLLTMKAPGRALPDDHALELPAGHGHPQDRPGHRRRLHDGGQAGQPDAADHAVAGRDHDARPACRTACSTSSPRRTPAPSWSR